MILTSLRERNARGRAAETAARPPTRTKSSISVVTNNTLKKAPAPALIRPCKIGSILNGKPEEAGPRETKAFGVGNCFPEVTARFRVHAAAEGTQAEFSG